MAVKRVSITHGSTCPFTQLFSNLINCCSRAHEKLNGCYRGNVGFDLTYLTEAFVAPDVEHRPLTNCFHLARSCAAASSEPM